MRRNRCRKIKGSTNRLSMAKIFITGGSGFIGTNLVEYLLAQGHEVLSADIKAPVKKEHEKFYRAVDILDSNMLNQAITSFNPDYIFHLAARTDLNGTSLEDYAVNTTGTSNVIAAANNVPGLQKMVFASSMLVCKAGYYPKHDQDYAPDTVYGTSKVEMEKVIRNATMQADWSIVRPTSIWGPWFKTPYRDFFDVVSKGRFVDIGKKYCTKTYGYIGNSIYQMNAILFSPAASKRTFYLGDEPPIFISDWAKEIASEMKTRQPVKIPFTAMKMGAIAGDVLKLVGLSFPMSSFRLKNMTTNNIIDLSATYELAPNPPFSRKDGVRITTEWLAGH